jgi:hypothetical protein
MEKIRILIITAVFLNVITLSLYAAEKKDGVAKKGNPIQVVLAMPGNVIKPIMPGTAGNPAKEDKDTVKSIQQESKSFKDMSVSELASYVKETVNSERGIGAMIPGFASADDKSGTAVYTYNGIAIDKLDKETLEKLCGRIGNQLTVTRTERLTRQLDNIRRIDAASRAARNPTGLPKTYAPQIPKTPPRATTIPKPPPRPYVPPPTGRRNPTTGRY